MKYPFSYGTILPSATGNAKAILTLQNQNVLTIPVETYQYIQNSDGSNKRIVSSQLTTFKENALNANYIAPDQIHLLAISSPLPFASFVSSSINAGLNGIAMDSRYQSRINFANYDVSGNLLDLNKINDKSLAYVWGYASSLPIAEITNASASKVFHTSFEDSNGTLNSDPRTGRYVRSGSFTFNLPSAYDTYKLTYWKKPSGGSWNYQESIIVVNAANAGTAMTIGLATDLLDEVRLLPITAMMITYTYDPVLGITTVTSPTNVTAYYSYDTFGRLMSVKDDQKKILKNYQYQFNSTLNYTNPEN
jgi:hypothetical protein